MPYRVTIKPPVLYAAWRGFTPNDLREVTDSLASLRRTLGHPAAYLSRIPADHHVFTEEEQKILLAFLQAILPHCRTIHHVVEGDGFLKSARLAIVTNLAVATPRARDFYTHATLEEGFRSVKALYGVDMGVPASSRNDAPPERASGAFREAARIVEGRPTPPRKGS